MSNQIIQEYKLGFSPDSYDDLLTLLRKESFTAEAMKLSGLFIQSEKGYFNRFRSRIMFPIQNYKGNVIAFGGRIFDKDDPAKYQNSPEILAEGLLAVFFNTAVVECVFKTADQRKFT